MKSQGYIFVSKKNKTMAELNSKEEERKAYASVVTANSAGPSRYALLQQKLYNKEQIKNGKAIPVAPEEDVSENEQAVKATKKN